MKVYEERIIPSRKDSFLKLRKCDICGKESKDEVDWLDENHGFNETEISVIVKQKKGENYPDCGWGTKYEVDLCPYCFKKELIPWLKSKGATIKEEEWYW